MKGLSIKQPWGQLFLDYSKFKEIRSWNTKFRGQFFIHAPKIADIEACEHFGYEDVLPTGCLIGTAILDDVKVYNNLNEFEADFKSHRNYWEPDKYPQYGFELIDVKSLDTLIPLKGQLNFFETGIEPHLPTR